MSKVDSELLLPPIQVHALLQHYRLKLEKRLGQNFLIDEVSLHRIVKAAEINNNESVLEIGAGLGSLTRYLCQHARWVVAVEVDNHLIVPLQEVLASYSNLTLVQGDILKLDPSELIKPLGADQGDYLVVANIPYYITSALLRRLLEASPPPKRMVLTLQKEVAERICAQPNQMSLLAISVQVYGHPRIMARIPSQAFYPPPKIDSAVVRIDLYPTPRLPHHELNILFRLAKAGFSQKRKTLRNAIAGGMWWTPQHTARLLDEAGIDSQRRAETLSLEEWENFARFIVQAGEVNSTQNQHPVS